MSTITIWIQSSSNGSCPLGGTLVPVSVLSDGPTGLAGLGARRTAGALTAEAGLAAAADRRRAAAPMTPFYGAAAGFSGSAAAHDAESETQIHPGTSTWSPPV